MFGDLLVRLDPWQAEYGTELPFEDVMEATDDDIAALDIELVPDAWRPICPNQAASPSQLVFVDGVRRLICAVSHLESSWASA